MKTYRCHYCDFESPDPEATYLHMRARECPRSDQPVPAWVRRAKERRLPVKVAA